MRTHRSTLFAAALGAAMAMPELSAEVVLPASQPLLSGLGDWVTRNNRPRRTKGAFGGSSRYPTKGRGNPAGSKLARKASEGKL